MRTAYMISYHEYVPEVSYLIRKCKLTDPELRPTLPEITRLLATIYRSNNHLVLLRNLTFESSGIYKCEVSADSPLFHTYYNESLMVVVELPEDGPKISGGQTHYAQGETARFNCTSSRSKPAAELTWYINEEPAKLSYLVPYYPYEHADGLISRRLGLSFTVEKGHFDEGEMNLKCEAVVAAVYDPVGQDETKVMERDPVVLERGEAAIVDQKHIELNFTDSTLRFKSNSKFYL
ncbi:uncharacterized protein LOC134776562 [Penaeus indicus]|uniref:uncharacterized protein LOC134776562 n=1 Tax=Penaeus indicus TaxID=29960 RepID=UPI00300C6D1A